MSARTIKTAIVLLAIQIGCAKVQLFSQQHQPKEEIVSVSAQTHQGSLYLNLSIKNEQTAGAYALVKISSTGLITVLQERQCVPNSLNQPILYSFMQENVQENDGNKYVLLRLSENKGAEPLAAFGWVTEKEKSALAIAK